MYDGPELQSANDALWHAIARFLQAAEVAGVPLALTRDITDWTAHWRDPALLLGQTCGYPLVSGLAGAVQVVAIPVYSFPGCAGPLHRSFIVVSAKSGCQNLAAMRGSRCAINSVDSNTGMNLLRAAVAPLAARGTFFSEVVVTGSHALSLQSVADEEADVAAIDCVSFAHLSHWQRHLVERTRILGETTTTPGLPLITGRRTSSRTLQILRAALDSVAADESLVAERKLLGLAGFVPSDLSAYKRVIALERFACAKGYPRLA